MSIDPPSLGSYILILPIQWRTLASNYHLAIFTPHDIRKFVEPVDERNVQVYLTPVRVFVELQIKPQQCFTSPNPNDGSWANETPCSLVALT